MKLPAPRPSSATYLCEVLHEAPGWREAGEQLLRAMDKFKFADAWDQVAALTLIGSTKWPDRKALVRLGQTRCDLSLPAINEIIEQAADVLAKLAPEVTKFSIKIRLIVRSKEDFWRLGRQAFERVLAFRERRSCS